MQVQPYLFFDGRCDDALNFYKTALGAKVDMLMRFKEAPDQSMVSPDSKDKVMHAAVHIGDTQVLMSDGRCQGKPSFQGFSLTVNAPDVAAAERQFNALAEGGQVQMPMSETFLPCASACSPTSSASAGWSLSTRAERRLETSSVEGTMNTATKGADFVISRVFDAPRELVWKAFTDPEHMKHWWGPKGSTVLISKMDLRVGGSYLGALRDASGQVMWGKFVYREIVSPQRLVWEHSFSDEHGGLTRHPLAPTWPLKLLTTVTFDEPRQGLTGVTLRWSPLNATAQEQATFDAAHDGMRGGWGGSFERLAAHLASAK